MVILLTRPFYIVYGKTQFFVGVSSYKICAFVMKKKDFPLWGLSFAIATEMRHMNTVKSKNENMN